MQDALNLNEVEYAFNPSSNPALPNEKNLKALREYVTYRIIQDLKRGWRYVLPNLEQTALLEIAYENLDKYCARNELWSSITLLNIATPEFRNPLLYKYSIIFEIYMQLISKCLGMKTDCVYMMKSITS